LALYERGSGKDLWYVVWAPADNKGHSVKTQSRHC